MMPRAGTRMNEAPPPTVERSRRWWIFNAVGIIGLMLQLSCLWCLTDLARLPYIVSATIATELTLLHNFVWHARWTWSDRPASPGGRFRRLVLFNMSCASTAVIALALMMLMVERFRFPYLVANLLSVVTCSIANFLLSDVGIFRKGVPRIAALMGMLSAAMSPAAGAAELRPQTVAAFDRYVRATEARMDRELDGRAPFLWIDRLPDAQRQAADARLRQRQIVVERLETLAGDRAIEIPNGICHHWVGTAFIPGASLDRVAALMQDYNQYGSMYRPAVRRSTLISRNGDHFRASLQLFMKRVLGVVLNTEYDVHYMPVASNRLHVRSYATRIAEVDHPDSPRPREKAVGNDNGFLWRFNNYCSIAERRGGAYVQCETISLSRDIPTGLGWVVGPFVNSIPRESLAFTLGRMQAMLEKSGA
jgi:putative flippase GtrA